MVKVGECVLFLILGDVIDWMVSPQSSYVPPNVTYVFGDEVFKDVIKLKWGHYGGS